MTGKIIWFSKEDGIGYVITDEKRMFQYHPPLIPFLLSSMRGDINNFKVGTKVTFHTIFHSDYDEDVIDDMVIVDGQ